MSLLLVGAAACPVAERAQQLERVRRIDVLTTLSRMIRNQKAVSRPSSCSLRPGGRQQPRIDYRWGGGDAGRMRGYATE